MATSPSASPPRGTIKWQPANHRDLGFGSRLARDARTRFVNRDGSFNVVRRGVPFWSTNNLYHLLLTMSWPRFLGLFSLLYLTVNAMFAAGYFACGEGGLEGIHLHPWTAHLLDCFFFSVQTLSTVGYGKFSPADLRAHLLVTMESLSGMLIVALATGLIFARFSRPIMRVLFSRKAVMAPYQGITAFQFRIINAWSNQLLDVHVRVSFSRLVEYNGVVSRSFEELTLERSSVTFFPLHWTIVHPIDANSPLLGMREEDFRSADVEFTVILTAFDETFSQTVQTRSSYKPAEIAFDHRFSDMFIGNSSAGMIVDLSRLHAIERAS